MAVGTVRAACGLSCLSFMAASMCGRMVLMRDIAVSTQSRESREFVLVVVLRKSAW
jgi:hypothetical protein